MTSLRGSLALTYPNTKEITSLFKEFDATDDLMHKYFEPILTVPNESLAINDFIADEAEEQGLEVIKLLDKFQFDMNMQINASNIQSNRERRNLVASIQNFYIHAKLVCNQTPLQSTQEKYNQIVGEKLLALAVQDFQHRDKVLRILEDIVFIPLGIITLGAAFFIKDYFINSKTFFVDKKTAREEALINFLDDELKSKDNIPGFNWLYLKLEGQILNFESKFKI